MELAAQGAQELILEQAPLPIVEQMQRRIPDLTRLTRMIDFRPRTPLAEIIRDVVADQRARRAAR